MTRDPWGPFELHQAGLKLLEAVICVGGGVGVGRPGEEGGEVGGGVEGGEDGRREGRHGPGVVGRRGRGVWRGRDSSQGGGRARREERGVEDESRGGGGHGGRGGRHSARGAGLLVLLSSVNSTSRKLWLLDLTGQQTCYRTRHGQPPSPG